MRLLWGILLSSTVVAAPDGLHSYRKQLRRLAHGEDELRASVAHGFPDALIAFEAPVERARQQPHKYPNARLDYTVFRAYYGDFAKNADKMVRADIAFAKSGDPRALPELFSTLMRAAKRAAKLDSELADAKPRWRNVIFGIGPGLARHTLDIRLRGLVAAIAKCPGAAPFCATKGFAKAKAVDRRKSITARVAVIDILARTDDAAARAKLSAVLAHQLSSLRVAAVEALVPAGLAKNPALLKCLRDPSPVVRRALLQEVIRNGANEPAWIEPLVKSFPASTGLESALTVQALSGLTRQRFGYDAAKWKAWYETHKQEILAGAFDAKKVKVQKIAFAPSKDTLEFYGVTAVSRGVVFVLTGSQYLDVPADWKIQRAKWRDTWSATHRQWGKDDPSHRATLSKQLKTTLAAMPKETRFGAVGLFGSFVTDSLGDRSLLKPGQRATKSMLKLVARLPGKGWCSPHEGLREAARIGELPPEEYDFLDAEIDTVFLFDTGDPAGGRFMTPESAIAAFKRFNRFRRLVVHTIRICNEGKPSETLMQGIARASGGTYLWAKSPP